MPSDTQGLNKAQIGERNYERLKAYLEDRNTSGTLPWRSDGRLIRHAICQDLGISRSVLLQNPRVKALIEEYESDPRHRENLVVSDNRAAGQRSPDEIEAQQRAKDLEAKVVKLEEENRYLKKELRRLGYSDLQLPDIGRLPW
jgi:Family of unknown function (DUF6262)